VITENWLLGKPQNIYIRIQEVNEKLEELKGNIKEVKENEIVLVFIKKIFNTQTE
jgi:hypothetical protein